MDFLENMKLRNIFGQDARTPPTFPGGNVDFSIPHDPLFGSGQMGNTPAMSLNAGPDPSMQKPMIGQDTNLDSIREGGHQALDKFLESIGHIPKREDYKPSLLRNIGAGIVGGFNGAEAGSKFRTKKYDQAVDDWKLKTNALGTASAQERLTNTSDANSAFKMYKEKNDAEETARRLSDSENKTAIAKQRADTLAELNNGGTVREDKVTGKTYLVTKVGEVKELPINTLTEAEKQNLITQGRLQVVEAQGQNSLDVANVREAGANSRNAATNATSRANNADTNKTRIATDNGPAGSGNSELERKRRLANNARQALIDHPEWKDIINVDGDDVTINASPNLVWGPEDATATAKILDDVRKVLGGDKGTAGSIPGDGKGTVAPNKPQSQFAKPAAAPGVPPIEKRIDGKEFTFPNGNVGKWNAAKKQWDIVSLAGKK